MTVIIEYRYIGLVCHPNAYIDKKTYNSINDDHRTNSVNPFGPRKNKIARASN